MCCLDYDGNKERLRYTWNNMKSRCYNLKDCAYVNYGGRGIGICEEWSSFWSTHRVIYATTIVTFQIFYNY